LPPFFRGLPIIKRALPAGDNNFLSRLQADFIAAFFLLDRFEKENQADAVRAFAQA
jgi:hypothetical protein